MPTDIKELLGAARFETPALDEGALQRRTRSLRRRRTLARGLAVAGMVAAVAVVGPTLLQRSSVDLVGAAAGPPAREVAGGPWADPSGEAEVVARTDYEEVVPGEPLTAWFTVTGEVPLGAGTGYGLQQWADDRWQEVSIFDPRTRASMQTLPLYVTHPQRDMAFVVTTDHLQPGWYRVTKTFDYYEQPPRPALTASIGFRVVPELSITGPEPDGAAAVTAVVDRPAIRPGEHVAFTVTNTGTAPLQMGVRQVDRLTEDGWTPAIQPLQTNPYSAVTPSPGTPPVLAAGVSTTATVDSRLLQPGRYRVIQAFSQPVRGMPRAQWPTVTAVADFLIEEPHS